MLCRSVMFRRQNSDKQSAKNQNTVPKDINTRKEAETEEQISANASGDNLINNILNTGNENAVKELLGAENITNEKGAEEDEDNLFGFFADGNEKQIIPAPKKENDAGKKKQEDDGDKLFDLFEDGKEKKNEIISTESVKKYGQKKPEGNIFPGDRQAVQEFYEDPADLQEGLESLWKEPDFSEQADTAADLRAQHVRKTDPDSWRLYRAKKKKKKAAENDIADADADQKQVAD